MDIKEVLKFPKFKDNKVSTKTVIAVTNISLDIHKIFDYLPITEYEVIPKRRGRKKKNEKVDYNKDVPDGSIITLKLENKLRGVDLKKKSAKIDKKKRGKYFRNCVSVVMIIENKKLNFKLSRNGKFQITGCKSNKQAYNCIQYFWKCIEKSIDIYTFSHNDHFEVVFVPAMRNIDFSLGFLIDREKLSEYINLMTKYYSMLEISFGYTGCNIKFPLNRSIDTLELIKFEIFTKDDKWISSTVPYSYYLQFLTPKEQEKKLNKDRYNTFLCFQSGNIIESGMCSAFMEEAYYDFIEIIQKCHNEIKEKLDTNKFIV